MINVLTCGDDFEELLRSEDLLANWRLHCNFILKSQPSAQTATAKQRVRQFLVRLAEVLLTKNGDVVSYFALSTLTDSFNFELL